MFAHTKPDRPTALTLKMEVLLSYEITVIFTSRHGVTSPIMSNLQAILSLLQSIQTGSEAHSNYISIPWAKRPGLEDQHSPPLPHLSSQRAW